MQSLFSTPRLAIVLLQPACCSVRSGRCLGAICVQLDSELGSLVRLPLEAEAPFEKVREYEVIFHPYVSDSNHGLHAASRFTHTRRANGKAGGRHFVLVAQLV